MPRYITGGERYNIPDEEISAFEAQYPDATIEYHIDGEIYDVPLKDKQNFVKKYPNATTTQPQSTIEQLREDTKKREEAAEKAYNESEVIYNEDKPYRPASVPQPTQAPVEGIVKAESDKLVQEQEEKRREETEAWLQNATPEELQTYNQLEKVKQQVSQLEYPTPSLLPAQREFEQKMDEINQAQRFGKITPQEADAKRRALEFGYRLASTPTDDMIRRTNARGVAELSKELDEKIAEREKEVEQEWAKKYAEDSALVKGGNLRERIYAANQVQDYTPFVARESDPEYMTLVAAKRSLEDAQKLIDEADRTLNAEDYSRASQRWHSGLARGAKDQLFDVRTWDMGITDAKDMAMLSYALDKEENGEELTDAEKALLDAKAYEMAVNAYFGSYLGKGYKVGENVGAMAPFMLEMAINPLSAVGSSVQSKLVRSALKKYGKGLYQRKLKYNALKYGSRLVGDIAGSAGMTLTSSLPRTYADAVSRHIGNVKPEYADYTGRAEFGGTEGGVSAGRAAYEAIAAGTTERLTEMSSYYLTRPFRGMKLPKLDNKAVKAVSNFVQNANNTDLARIGGEIAKKTQWGGVVGEYFEEVENNILNAALVGDMKFDNSEEGVFNLQNNWLTLQSVAAVGGSIATLKTGYYPIYKYQQSRALKQADLQAADAFGDEWDGIKASLNGLDEQSFANLIALGKREDVTPMQKEAAKNYFQANVNLHAAQQAAIKHLSDAKTSPEEVEISQSYDIGRSLYTPEEMNEAKRELEDAKAEVRRTYRLEEDKDVDEFLGETPLESIRGSLELGGSMEEAEIKLRYLNAKATYDGMLDQAEADVNDKVVRSNALIDRQVNKTMNGIQQVTLNNGEEVFVIDGVIAANEDGSIDRENTDKDVIYLDGNGKAQFTSRDNISSAKPFVDVATYKQQNANNIIEQGVAESAAKIDGVLAMNVGDKFYVMDDRGLAHQAQVTANFEDGNVAISLDNAEPQHFLREAVQAMANAYKDTEYQEKKAAQEEKERADMQQTEAQLQQEQEAINRAEEEAKQAEQPETATSRVPVGENGNLLYEQADSDTAWDALVEQAKGNEATAQKIADMGVKKAQKTLDEVKQSTINEDMSIEEMLEAENAHNDAVAAAEANLNKWKEIASVPQRRAEEAQRVAETEAKAEAMQERIDKANEAISEEQKQAEQRMRMSNARAALQNGGRYQSENAELGAPIDFADFVMRAIATGGVRFIWGNNQRTGTRGLGSHTGFGEQERRKRIGILSNAGLYPEVAAEQLLSSYADEIGYDPNIDTSDALSTILDVVMSYTTPKEMMEAAQARHAEVAEMSAREAEYYAEGEYYKRKAADQNMPVGEYLFEENLYEEVIAEELKARDVEKDKIDAIFVEHYLEEYENERTNQSLRQGISGQKRNGTNNEGSGNILPTAGANQRADIQRGTEGQRTDAPVSNEGNQDLSASQTLGEPKSVEDTSTPQMRADEGAQPAGKKLSRAMNMLRIPLRKRINDWSKKVGVSAVIVEDFSDVTSQKARANILEAESKDRRVTGWVEDGKVYLYMPNLRDIDEIDETYTHEVVGHKGMDAMLGKEEYRKFCLDVFDQVMTEADRKTYLNYEGVSDLKDETEKKAKAADEYIAHLSESTNLTKREASMWDKIVDLFRKMLESLGFPQDISKLTIEDMIRKSYNNLLEKKISINELGGELSSEGILFSIKTNDTVVANREKQLKRSVRNGLLSNTEANDIREASQAMLEIAEVIAQAKNSDGSAQFPSFSQWNGMEVRLNANGKPLVSAIKSNGEYPMNIDFAKDCIKRDATNRVLNRLAQVAPDAFTSLTNEQLADINNIIKRHGLSVPCVGCFVEAKRFRSPDYARSVVSVWNSLVDAVRSQNEDAILKELGNKVSYIRIINHLKNTPTDMVYLSEVDINAPEKYAALMIEHPQVPQLLQATQGQNNAQLVVPEAVYYGDVLNLPADKSWDVDAAYSIGGVRLQSFSDFKAKLFFDYCQVLADLASKKLPAHTYTKVPSYAELFGLTGMKINLSLFFEGKGVDENGEYIYSQESIDPTFAYDIQSREGYTENVGTMAVGVSDEHILKMLADDRIRSISPYHKSGINPMVAKKINATDFMDYTNEQNAVVAKSEKMADETWAEYYQRITARKDGQVPNYGTKVVPEFNLYDDLLDTEDPIATAKNYVEYCQNNGIVPKFAHFVYNEDGSFNDGYFKLLYDFAVTNKDGNYAPQKEVKWDKSSMPANTAEILTSALEVEEATIAKNQAQTDAVVRDIIDEVIKPDGKIQFRVADDTAAEQEQIIAEAKANGTYLKAPNGKDTNLTPEQWAMVRTKAFKKWFGDWEKVARIEKLKGSKDAVITGEEIEASDDLKQYRKNAQMYGRTLQGEYINADTGAVISLQRGRHNGGINEVLQHNYKDVAHLQSVAAIPQIIENGIYIESQPNRDAETNPNVSEYQMFVCGLNIGGEDYTVLAKVAVDKNGNRYYDHNLVSVEKGKLIDIANNKQSAKSSGFGTTPDTESTTNSQYKFKEIISILQTNSSKIVDANGEPKVVYHRTPNEFTEFDPKKSRYNVFGKGFYFANKKSPYTSYGEHNMSCWLAVTNPIILNEQEISSILENKYGDNTYSIPYEERIKTLDEYIKQNGYDGVVYLGRVEELNEYIAFEPNQIKSATENVGTFDAGNNDIRFRTAPAFYSNAERAVENIKQEKATPEQWLKMIEKNGGLKAGEDKWLGLSDWLKASDKKTLTKQEVLDYIKANEIQIEEVVYGSLEDTPRFKELRDEYKSLLVENGYNNERAFEAMVDKYGDDFDLAFEGWGNDLHINSYYGTESAEIFLDARDINDTRIQYTTDGLNNKREIALVVPTIESWNESDEIHFGDAGNGRAVAWVRFGETTDADGNRVLVIDEIQSKRHQEGREKGYISEEVQEAQRQRNYLYSKMYSTGLTEEESERYYQLGEYIKENYGIVPAAPFEKNWAELAMKRMLRYAAENGFDKVAWTTGEQQVERYDISKSVDNIKSEDNNVEETADGTLIVKNITIYAGGSVYNLFVDANGVVRGREYDGKKLSDIVGKPLAEKLMEQGDFELEGDGLRIGGEGMKAFYDQMIPSFMNKYGKKWGVKVGEVTMPNLEENNTMHSVDVTPAMRESVMQGQPMFRVTQDKARFDELQEEYDALDKNDEVALNAWRDKNKLVVGQYIREKVAEFALPCKHFFVYDSEKEADLRKYFELFLLYVEKLTGESTIGENTGENFEYFKNAVLKNEDGGYNEILDLIVIKTSKPLTEKWVVNCLFHEQAHAVVKKIIPANVLPKIWEEAKTNGYALASHIEERYNEDEKRGEEVLTYSIGSIAQNPITRPLLEQFIKGEGDVVVNDILDIAKSSLPLRNEYLTKILNFFRDERRKEKGDDIRVEALYPEGLDGLDGLLSRNRGDRKRGGSRVLDSVSQKGLRGVVSEDALVSFFKGVYNRVDNATRNEIYEYVKRNGDDFWKGTEQYLASLAENDTPLDGGVRDAFVQMLNNNGIEAEGLTDNDIRYMMWRTNQLKDNKGALSVAEDVVMKQKLGVDNAQPVADTSFRVVSNGRAIRDKYDKRVNTGKGKLKATAYNFQEAIQDEMLSLKIYQQLLEEVYGVNIPSYLNVYNAENSLSSRNKVEMDRFVETLYEDMMQEIDELIKVGATEQEVRDYVVAKSGIERSIEFTVRDYINEQAERKQLTDKEAKEQLAEIDEKVRNSEITPAEADAMRYSVNRQRNTNLYDKDIIEGMRKLYEEKRDALRDRLNGGEISFDEWVDESLALAQSYTGKEVTDAAGLTDMAKRMGLEDKDWLSNARKVANEFENKYNGKQLDEFEIKINTRYLWDAINACNNATLKKLYDTGVISKDLYDKLQKQFMFYVPMSGFTEDVAEDVYSYIGNETGAFTPPIKKAGGRLSESDDPFAIIGNKMQSAILQGNRNAMKIKFLNLHRQFPTDLITEGRFWEVKQPDGSWLVEYPEIPSKDASAEVVKAAVDEFNERMKRLKESGDARIYRGKANVPYKITHKSHENQHQITVRLMGEPITMFVNGNPQLAKAINGKLKSTTTFWLYNVLAPMNRYMSSIVTSFNPDFIAPNVVRDVQQAFTMTLMDYGVKDAGKLAGLLPKALATTIKYANDIDIDPEIKTLYEEFLHNGGQTGYSHIDDVDKWKSRNKSRIDRLSGVAKVAQGAVDGFVFAKDGISTINGFFEDTTRFATYMLNRQNGKSIGDSIKAAKDISTNFNKKGSGATEGIWGAAAESLRHWIMFFNPMVQGAYQHWDKMKKHTKKYALITAWNIGLGFTAALLNDMGSADDDEEMHYLNQNEYTRRSNLFIYIGDSYIKIPLAPIFREYYAIGDIIYTAIKGRITAWQATKAIFNTVRSIFNLEGQSSLTGKDGEKFRLGRFVAPDALAVIPDIAENANFMGSPIYRDAPWDELKPEYEKVYNGTWQPLINISKGINNMMATDIEDETLSKHTGKIAAKNSSILINPAVWQYAIEQATGGIGSTIGNTINTVGAVFDPEREVEWNSVPIIRRFYTVPNERNRSRNLQNDYYEITQEQKRRRDLYDFEKADTEGKADEILKQLQAEESAYLDRVKETQNDAFGRAELEADYHSKEKNEERKNRLAEAERLRQQFKAYQESPDGQFYLKTEEIIKAVDKLRREIKKVEDDNLKKQKKSEMEAKMQELVDLWKADERK